MGTATLGSSFRRGLGICLKIHLSKTSSKKKDTSWCLISWMPSIKNENKTSCKEPGVNTSTTVTIRQGEEFRAFIVRLETSYRLLVAHEVELPREVRGWFLMKKLHLDATQEALLLTATQALTCLQKCL